MEEIDDLQEVKEEKPEIMEEDQVPGGPVQVKIIKIGGNDKSGQGVDHLEFVEMAKLARQAVAIANKVGGRGNNGKQLLVPRSMEVGKAKDNSRAPDFKEKQAVGASRLTETATVTKANKRRDHRAAWTEEQWATYRKKEAERKRRKRAEMSEEERAAIRKQNAEYQKRRRTVMTPEEIERSNAVSLAGNRRRREGMTPEEVDEFRARMALRKRKRRQNMSEEEKAEMRQRNTIYNLMRRAKMTEVEKEQDRWKAIMKVYARRAQMTREEREEENRREAERNKKWRKGLTGEKLERYNESVRSANKKYQKKHPQVVKYHRRVREETPEQRWKRLRAFRICQAKRLLKRKLEREGFPQDEIEERVKDLVKKMKEEPMPPPEAVSAYKPRPRKDRKEPLEDSEQEPSTLRRSKNICPPNSSKDSSLFSDMKTIEAEPIVEHIQLVQFPTDYFADHKEIFKNDDDEAGFADAFNDCDIQSDPLGNNDEESDIEESSNSPTTSPPALPVETPRTNTNSFLAHPPSMIQPQPLAAPPLPPQTCSHCPATFSEENFLKEHLRSSHFNKCFKCPKCKEIVFSPKELSDHFKTHKPQPQNQENPSGSTNSSPFTCLKCSTSVEFQSQEKLSEHVRLSHPGSFFPCLYCKVVMYSKSSLATHLSICKMASLVCVDPRQARQCKDW